MADFQNSVTITCIYILQEICNEVFHKVVTGMFEVKWDI